MRQRALVAAFADGGATPGAYGFPGDLPTDAAGQAFSIRVDDNSIRALAGDPQCLRDLSSVLSPGDTSDERSSVADVAIQAASWLEISRASAASARDEGDALAAQTSDALQKDVGVSLDEQLTRMLDVERSYQASARLISTIDQMLADFLQTIR